MYIGKEIMKNKIKLQFEYSVGSETQRVLNTIKKWGWYMEHGYKPRLPEKFDITKIHDYNKAEVHEIISKEYSEDFYEPVCDKINTEWQKYCDFKDKIENLDLNMQNTYIIQLTKYGTSGSYKIPNKVVLSTRCKEPVPVLIHEMIHLAIEDSIIKYGIEQFAKERIVDLILAKIYPDFSKMQNQLTDKENQKIDKIFNKFFPDIKEIIKQISKLK